MARDKVHSYIVSLFINVVSSILAVPSDHVVYIFILLCLSDNVIKDKLCIALSAAVTRL